MTGSRNSRVVGIVLRARHLGEADRVFTVLTFERGKIDVVAKGVRRSRSSFAGRLEFMNEVSLDLHHGRSFDVITGADVIASRFDAIVAPDAFATASLVAEYIDACCEPEQPMPEVYALLRGVLGAFERVGQPTDLLPRFELRLLHAIGLGPQLERCVRCEVPIDRCSDICFDVEDGGLVCGSCRVQLVKVLELNAQEVENLRALARPAGGELPVTMWAAPRSIRVIESLLTHHLGHRPRVQFALDILRALPQVMLTR